MRSVDGITTKQANVIVIVLHLDETDHEFLKRYGISWSITNDVNKLGEIMPQAECRDLLTRWSSYWTASYRLASARGYRNSEGWRQTVSDHNIPLDDAEKYLAANIAEMEAVRRNFENFIKDSMKVFA